MLEDKCICSIITENNNTNYTSDKDEGRQQRGAISCTSTNYVMVYISYTMVYDFMIY